MVFGWIVLGIVVIESIIALSVVAVLGISREKRLGREHPELLRGEKPFPAVLAAFLLIGLLLFFLFAIMSISLEEKSLQKSLPRASASNSDCCK